MFKFITDKPFLVNFLAAVLLAFLLIFLTLQMLGWITKHGEYLTVPSVKGKSTEEATRFLESKGFEVVVQDSIYTDTLQRGTIIKQLPDANATVKINRSVYITVNRYIPPLVAMPSLEGKSLNFVLNILDRSHLVLGDTVYRADFMKGAIIEQRYKGNRIEPGAKVQWGSRIDLVISGGLNENILVVPDLIGLTYQQAKEQIDSLGILLNLVPDAAVRDTLNAFIYKQNPSHLDVFKKQLYIKSGMVMDIWLSPVMINLYDSSQNN
jgi:beta-lactam-binding protein with PASTA domain